MKDEITFTCRLPAELRDQFKLRSTQEGRSMAKQLIKLVQDFIQSKENDDRNEKTA